MKNDLKIILMRLVWIWFKFMQLLIRKQNPSLRKVLILNLTGIGDTVCLIPFVTKLRENFPEMELWGGFSSFYASMIDDMMHLDGRLDFQKLSSFISAAKKENFSLIIVPGWALKHTIAALGVGAPTIGYLNDLNFSNAYLNVYQLETIGLPTLSVSQDMRKSHLVERPNLILRYFNLDQIKYMKYQQQYSKENESYIVIHAAARFAGRCWPPENFALLIDEMFKVLPGLECVYLVGGNNDYELNESIINIAKGNVVNLARILEFNELHHFIGKARLFIGNDSGPMHIAAFSGTPTIGIMGPNLPELSGPVGQHTAVLFHKQPCSPCEQRYCPFGYKCIKMITVEEGLQKAKELWLK